MKIFLFNPDTGFYLGEDFADEVPMVPGTFAIPSDATTVAPPQAGPGQVPVFDVGQQRWELHQRHAGGPTEANEGQYSRSAHGEVKR